MVGGKRHVGIGFATGRIGFQNVLRAYICHLRESHFLIENEICLSLFVAYDSSYNNTRREDYDNLTGEERGLFRQCCFIGEEDIREELEGLQKSGTITGEEAALCFGNGYAVQRNVILYKALQQKVDYLIFLDDDEYPLAVTQSGASSLWSGQLVLENHVKYLKFADFTNGWHCGYLSPVPAMEFDGILTEALFHQFTDALSSDVLRWEDVHNAIECGGVTYADKQVLVDKKTKLVPFEQGARFISGGNLGINLTRPERVQPFYNPPGARGEDSILSTCLEDYTVKKIPVYTFHDGFSFYGSLLKGVLPISLKKISLYDSGAVIDRFYQACIGWIRYKPLYTYLTQPDDYEEIMEKSVCCLEKSLPAVCAYFNDREFMRVLDELNAYRDRVGEDGERLRETKKVWRKVVEGIGRQDSC